MLILVSGMPFRHWYDLVLFFVVLRFLTCSSYLSQSRKIFTSLKMRLQIPTLLLSWRRMYNKLHVQCLFKVLTLPHRLLVRLVAGPCCDHFGPKVTFAGCLLLGAIPTALAGTVTTATGLMVLRFFIGILGGSFVPCQVWSTGFFDKNIVGTANSLTGGWGNS